jgi:hypothetical protein
VKIPAWFTRKKAPKPPETVAQARTELDQLRDRLAEARADVAAAEERVTAAATALDTERTATALEALRVTKSDRDDLAELARIAEADVTRADAALTAARRVELERERTAALERLSLEAVRAIADPLLDRAVGLYLQLAELYADGETAALELRRLSSRVIAIEEELGIDAHRTSNWIDDSGRSFTPVGPPDVHVGALNNPVRLVSELQTRARALPMADPARRYLEILTDALDRSRQIRLGNH